MIKETATDIRDHLQSAGFEAYAFLPARIVPPVAVVQAASPFINTDGVSFGQVNTRWQISLIGPLKDNEQSTDTIYQMTEDALVELIDSKYSVDTVGAPYALQANNATYVAVDINLRKRVTL